MSVTFAPRARMAVKAAWPGVSRKVMLCPLCVDAVGADVLGDAAGFARRDARLADRVHQRGLAVVDVAHEGHDRRAQLESRPWSAAAAPAAARRFLLLGLWTPPPFSRFSLSKTKPCLLANLGRDVGSIVWLS